MKRRFIPHDARGVAGLELGLLLPIFLLMIYGIIQIGNMLWTQAALYHGSQMAARCAALQLSNCASTELTQQYAAAQSYGLRPAASVFSVTNETCGTQVVARMNYQPFSALTSSLSVQLEARSCFSNG